MAAKDERLIDMTRAELVELVRDSIRAELGITGEGTAAGYQTLQAVADHFDVSTQTVRAWIRRGCPAYNVGGAAGWRLQASAVEAWLRGSDEKTG